MLNCNLEYQEISTPKNAYNFNIKTIYYHSIQTEITDPDFILIRLPRGYLSFII